MDCPNLGRYSSQGHTIKIEFNYPVRGKEYQEITFRKAWRMTHVANTSGDKSKNEGKGKRKYRDFPANIRITSFTSLNLANGTFGKNFRPGPLL